MTIYIKNLTFNAIIGILPKERAAPQKVVVHAKVTYKYKKDVFINYATLSQLIKNSIQQNKYELIEEALLSLHLKIKTKFSIISSVKLKITKPTILDECEVSAELKRNY